MIESATPRDLPGVRALLQQNGLPLDGIDEHVSTMVVIRDGTRVIGTAAVELYADAALLRSVAVDPAFRGRGLGRDLTQAALDMARAQAVDTVFLLTMTAERFFPRFGFSPISRDEAPASIRNSVEFRSACPASAVVMRAPLTRSS